MRAKSLGVAAVGIAVALLLSVSCFDFGPRPYLDSYYEVPGLEGLSHKPLFLAFMGEGPTPAYDYSRKVPEIVVYEDGLAVGAHPEPGEPFGLWTGVLDPIELAWLRARFEGTGIRYAPPFEVQCSRPWCHETGVWAVLYREGTRWRKVIVDSGGREDGGFWRAHDLLVGFRPKAWSTWHPQATRDAPWTCLKYVPEFEYIEKASLAAPHAHR